MNWLIATDRTAVDAIGGSTVTAIETSLQWLAAGDSVYWLTGRLNSSLPIEGEYRGIQVRTFDALGEPGLVGFLRMRKRLRFELQRLLAAKTIDAAVLHHPIAGDAMGPLLHQAGIPSCYFFHGPWAPEFLVRRGGRGPWSALGSAMRRRVEGRALRVSDHIVVFSRTMEGLLRHNHPDAREPVRITPGINPEVFRPAADRREARRSLSWPENALLVLVVRRLVPRTGVDLLLSAFAQVTERFPESRLLVGGKGPLSEELKAQASSLGIGERVDFLGYIPDEQLPAAYGAADLVAMPSRALEGLGLVTLEAMACGTAVFATPVGGNVELLEPLRPDLITSDTTVDALTITLRELLGSGRERLHALGMVARQHVVERYGWDRTSADLKRVLGLA
jgi:glycosyltransferase involved in cell wall biosynthesis